MEPSEYFMQAAISQYFLDNMLYQLHMNNLTVIDTGDALGNVVTVGYLKLLLGGSWDNFTGDAPCKAII